MEMAKIVRGWVAFPQSCCYVEVRSLPGEALGIGKFRASGVVIKNSVEGSRRLLQRLQV